MTSQKDKKKKVKKCHVLKCCLFSLRAEGFSKCCLDLLYESLEKSELYFLI
jgi:hypothetical protein